MRKETQTKTGRWIAFILGGTLLLAAGCVKEPVSPAESQPQQFATARDSTSSPQARDESSTIKTKAILRFGRYVVFDDKSGSVSNARISPLNEQDILSLIDILRLTGGELAFGLINEASDRPLLRLRIVAPPTAPVRLEVGNPFEQAEEEAKYQEKMEAHQKKLRLWQADADKSVAEFLSALRPRLQLKAAAKATDVWSALRRSELFLNEPTNEKSTSNYVILNTDGLDTVHSARPEIKSSSTLILINGTGVSGVLDALHPIRFESARAAFLYINEHELGGSK